MEQLESIHLPLELVLNIITCSLPKPNVLIAPSHPITQLLLSFTLVCKETRRLANRYLLQHCVYLSHASRLSSYLLTASTRPELRNISTLFLAPFGHNIETLPTMICLQDLFALTCITLKRLVIDISLESLHPYRGLEGFFNRRLSKLNNLEEFVSVRDGLVNYDPPCWTHWKHLKRLAIYGQHVDDEFWHDVATMSELETVVLTRVPGGIQDSNFKKSYFKHCHRRLKVLLCNVHESQVPFTRMRRVGWDTVDPEKKMTIATYTIPLLFEGESPKEACQEYVRVGAENGTLWGWEGETIHHPPTSGIKLRVP
jgi:hypothetical protein